MRNSTIKPYRETICIDCVDMEEPDKSIKITVSNRCLLGPHFHYKKYQEEKFKAKQQSKPKKETKPKIKDSKPRNTNLFNLSQPRLLKLAEEAVNTFIRQRDWKGDHFICISCSKAKSKDQMNAGHFYSAGNHSYLRFNEDNVNSQCVFCNLHLHGNLLPYRDNLIKKIGQERFDKLTTWKNHSHSWDKIQLVGIIQLYREKLKEYIF